MIDFGKDSVSLFVVVIVFILFDGGFTHKLKETLQNFYICSMIIIAQNVLKNTKINGITLFPFIILRNTKDRFNKILINHEKIHLRQQIEMLVVPFYIWYILEYSIRYLQVRNKQNAYRNISFEREAYENDSNLDYIKKRKWYAFIKYL